MPSDLFQVDMGKEHVGTRRPSNGSAITVRSKTVIVLLFCLFILCVIYWRELRGMENGFLRSDHHPWQEVAAGKRKELYEKIPKEWHLSPVVLDQGRNERKLVGDFIEGLLDLETRRITSLDAVDIVESVRNGSITAVAVTQAFCKRAAYAHQLV